MGCKAILLGSEQQRRMWIWNCGLQLRASFESQQVKGLFFWTGQRQRSRYEMQLLEIHGLV